MLVIGRVFTRPFFYNMKRISFVFFISLISFFYFSRNFISNKVEEKISKEISFSFVGDLMCHSPIFESAKIENDSFDFNPIFENVKDELSQSDFTIGNLETVISGKEFGFSGYPNFNSPIEFLQALKNSGFDVLITCNNHSLDRGIKGLINTQNNLEKIGFKYVGTKKTENDSILILEKNNLKVSLLAYTYGLNGNILPKSKYYLINIIDTNNIKKDILKAKKSSDAVIVYLHFGEEYQRKPNSFQKVLVDKVFSFGANVIIASHPHVIQDVVYDDEKLVAYSLGNFLSNQRWRFSDSGIILSFTISNNDSNKIKVKDFAFIPTWVYKGTLNNKVQIKILKADTLIFPSFLTKDEIGKVKQAFYDTKFLINYTN